MEQECIIQVDFQNNGERNKWIDMNSLVIQAPTPILEYINKRHLQNDEDFKWITRLAHNGDHHSSLR